MFFWKRKKEKSFEKKLENLDTTVLSERDYKDGTKIEQYVVERLEQMIELTQEVESEKSEYRMVSAYLGDIQMMEEMPQEERDKIQEVATNVVQLNAARTEFLNSAKKLSDAQFAMLEQQEREVPDAIKRLASNEMYRDTIERDMKYLEREKSEWVMRKEFLVEQRTKLKNLLYIWVGLAVTAAVVLGILQFLMKMDMYYGWMALVFVTAIAIALTYWKIQDDGAEIAVAERNRNRAVVLLNKVKIKYVNIVNAVDYACEKYHVRSSAELNEQWEYYMEAVREREKYQRTNEDLDYFNGRLVRLLRQYQFYDAQVWVNQAVALVDPKEMVEVKHGLIARRQKLRSRIEYNLGVVAEQRKEATQLLDKVGNMRPQVEQILQTIDKLEETEA